MFAMEFEKLRYNHLSPLQICKKWKAMFVADRDRNILYIRYIGCQWPGRAGTMASTTIKLL